MVGNKETKAFPSNRANVHETEICLLSGLKDWIPAFAGMTETYDS